ncbi:unnamed protein product [Dovyalis caffra]|uniref:Uncharacterized protein n=1 Tax=Dovyalis caffra TaxID=77055 RepID=A0AAV1S2N3_9ROSI|nr:unnamed protein product [Dovyalis caffra]
MEEGRMLGYEAKGRVRARLVQARGRPEGVVGVLVGADLGEGVCLCGRRPRLWRPCEAVVREKSASVVMAVGEGQEGYGGAVGEGAGV